MITVTFLRNTNKTVLHGLMQYIKISQNRKPRQIVTRGIHEKLIRQPQSSTPMLSQNITLLSEIAT